MEAIAIGMPYNFICYFNGLYNGGGPFEPPKPVLSSVERQILPTKSAPTDEQFSKTSLRAKWVRNPWWLPG